MYGSEISKLLSFDYIKDKEKVSTQTTRGPLKAPPNPSVLNGAAHYQQDHRRKVFEMDQRGADRAPLNRNNAGNGPIPSDYKQGNQNASDQNGYADQNGRGRRIDSASSYTTEYQEKMAGQNGSREQNGRARRVDSASSISSYTTEYQEKMAGSGMSSTQLNAAARYNNRPDSGGPRVRSGSVSS